MFVQSSLLSSILGELPNEKGVLKVKGQLTYAAQQPWVYPGTIRSNILFGKELDIQKYERVIKACALKRVSFFLFTFISHKKSCCLVGNQTCGAQQSVVDVV